MWIRDCTVTECMRLLEAMTRPCCPNSRKDLLGPEWPEGPSGAPQTEVYFATQPCHPTLLFPSNQSHFKKKHSRMSQALIAGLCTPQCC